MAESLYATHEFLSVIRSGGPIFADDIIVRTLSVGTATAIAGHIMGAAGETANYVDCADDGDLEAPVGILLSPVLPDDGYDLDDTLTDGIEVYILKRHTRGSYQVAVHHSPVSGVTTLAENRLVRVGLTKGEVQAFTWADSAASTDSLQTVVGTVAHYDIMSSTANTTLIINWGL